MEKDCLSYWFPRLQESGVLVPCTEIVRTDINLLSLCDGELPRGWGAFLAEMNVAIGRLTGNANPTPPFFLRTGHGSGKHDWNRTCYVDLSCSTLPNHIASLVEWSILMDFIGLPTDVWAIRELLPLQVEYKAKSYRGMPVAREYRAFMVGGQLQCVHPYWPVEAVRKGNPDVIDWRERLARISHIGRVTRRVIEDIVSRIAPHFAGTGDWSVDVCPTNEGLWYVTDMAQAARSFHWPECPYCPVEQLPRPKSERDDKRDGDAFAEFLIRKDG